MLCKGISSLFLNQICFCGSFNYAIQSEYESLYFFIQYTPLRFSTQYLLLYGFCFALLCQQYVINIFRDLWCIVFHFSLPFIFLL